MNSDDIIYLSLLGGSIALGPLYHRIPPGVARRWAGTVVGLMMATVVSGAHVIHPITLTVMNIFILKFVSKRWCHVVSFVVSFLHLLVFRLSELLGLPPVPPHTNAILMMMTLKMIGVCYEVHDTWRQNTQEKDTNTAPKSTTTTTSTGVTAAITATTVTNATTTTATIADKTVSCETELRRRKVVDISTDKQEEEEEKKKKEAAAALLEQKKRDAAEEAVLASKYEAVNPSSIDVMHYSFCYCGVLTGPYYKYRVYEDFVCGRGANSVEECLRFCGRRMRWLPLYAVLFLILETLWPLKYAESDAIFMDHGILYRIAYMSPIFMSMRMRLYIGFVLSEAVCIAAGLGAYPTACEAKPGKGPTKHLPLEGKEGGTTLPYNFEAIHNVDEYGTEFTGTVREGMRCWNMTVQYWLAAIVYKRLTLPRPIKEAATMLTSAFWHGVHPGYYLSMLTVPFILMIEDYYARLIRRRLSGKPRTFYDWVTWVLKTQWFAYMGVAFLLRQAPATLNYWRSIGYVGHGLILGLHAIAQFINLVWIKAQSKLKKASLTAFGTDSKLRVKTIPEVEEQVRQDKLRLKQEAAASRAQKPTTLVVSADAQEKKTL